MRPFVLVLLLPLVTCLVLAGCGDGSQQVVPVSGKVTLDGKPVAKVRVVFQPHGKNASESAAGSVGITDAEGQYTLKTMTATPQPGAAVGTHTVDFAPAADPAEADAIDPQPVVLTPELRAVMRRTQTFEVKAGVENQANFDLRSK